MDEWQRIAIGITVTWGVLALSGSFVFLAWIIKASNGRR